MLFTTTTITVALGTVSQLANAQGLVYNCTWQTGFMVDSFLGMYCNNDNWDEYSYDWTWLDTSPCLTNSGGNLYPYNRHVAFLYILGNYWSTCGNCSVFGTNVTFFMTCDCLNAHGQFGPASYDLNQVVYNHDGVLGCFEHLGNKTEMGPF
ncbi:hypothetical protein K449DRAFT_470445 [Hypoxylon sp. EC38]|nr:hypothetical protein K449DRAFT_470445 [Hypoxylon sp. EC38]